jgi:hypothetical protein
MYQGHTKYGIKSDYEMMKELKAENSRLKKELAAANKGARVNAEVNKSLVKKNERLKAKLIDIEWYDWDDSRNGGDCCPFCLALRHAGVHYEDCIFTELKGSTEGR